MTSAGAAARCLCFKSSEEHDVKRAAMRSTSKSKSAPLATVLRSNPVKVVSTTGDSEVIVDVQFSSEDGVRPIEVPLARLSQSILSQTLDSNTVVRTLIRSQNEQAEAEERAHRKYVVEGATPGQQKVLRAFAKGLHPREVSEHLFIANTTVSAHTTVLLELCRIVWSPIEKERRDYRFLQMKFANHFINAE
jgi:DNA-binding NarL/FixJ family response regulator